MDWLQQMKISVICMDLMLNLEISRGNVYIINIYDIYMTTHNVYVDTHIHFLLLCG